MSTQPSIQSPPEPTSQEHQGASTKAMATEDCDDGSIQSSTEVSSEESSVPATNEDNTPPAPAHEHLKPSSSSTTPSEAPPNGPLGQWLQGVAREVAREAVDKRVAGLRASMAEMKAKMEVMRAELDSRLTELGDRVLSMRACFGCSVTSDADADADAESESESDDSFETCASLAVKCES